MIADDFCDDCAVRGGPHDMEIDGMGAEKESVAPRNRMNELVATPRARVR
jgi:hypothetical protein